MKVKFIKDIKASNDGINIIDYKANMICEINDSLAISLIKSNFVVEYKEIETTIENPVEEKKVITDIQSNYTEIETPEEIVVEKKHNKKKKK